VFDNLDLALTMLQVTSGLAGLTLVSTGFFPFFAEHTQGRYARFVAESRIALLLKVAKLAFCAFSLSVFLSLVWCIFLTSGFEEWGVILTCLGCLSSFLIGFTLTTYSVLSSLRLEIFMDK
jgi:hypothetical protein